MGRSALRTVMGEAAQEHRQSCNYPGARLVSWFGRWPWEWGELGTFQSESTGNQRANQSLASRRKVPSTQERSKLGQGTLFIL